MAGRFAAILVGRRAVRRIGVAVAYDLRNRLYAHLETQGPAFFARYRIGDLMAPRSTTWAGAPAVRAGFAHVLVLPPLLIGFSCMV